MSKRKAMARRESSGKVRRPPALPSPLEVVRLRDAALRGMRDAVWGSTLGWLFLSGKIDPAQFAAGKHWLRLATDYAQACQAPRQPRSAVLDAMGGTPADPDSEAGQKEARRQANVAADYLEALAVLQRHPACVLDVVMVVCEQGTAPAGLHELHDLQRGLNALAGARFGGRLR